MLNNFRYEGEKEGQYRTKIQEVVEFILDKDYGSTILHSEISKMLGYNIETEIEEKNIKVQ